MTKSTTNRYGAPSDRAAAADRATPPDGVSRRSFLGTVGATAAVAGAGLTVQGCVRKPVERILPYAQRPEDLIPGKPSYFATATHIGDEVFGLVVESQDGRPTKIEGNPAHPLNAGTTSAMVQGSVRDLYDPDRSKAPSKGGDAASWEDAWKAFDAMASEARSAKGAGTAIVLPTVMSPTLRRLLGEAAKAMPQLSLYHHDPMVSPSAAQAAAVVGGTGAYPVYDLSKADVIVGLDSDMFSVATKGGALPRGFAARRTLDAGSDTMSRLYAIESNWTQVGVLSDDRLRVKSALVGEALKALSLELGQAGVPVAGGVQAAPKGLGEADIAFVKALAKDLAANRGKSVLHVGGRQPAWVHALAHAINKGLGAEGVIVQWRTDADAPPLGSIAALAKDLTDGKIDRLLVLGTNPTYATPGAVGFDATKAKASFHLGLHLDETGKACTWHMPLSHWLEAWGDLRAQDLAGTVSVQQPLIAPIFGTPSDLEVVSRLTTGEAGDGQALVKATYGVGEAAGVPEKTWRKWLFDGIVTGAGEAPTAPQTKFDGVGSLITAAGVSDPAGTEVNFHLDPRLGDGRYANNPWMQETPDPVTKLTWDNAAILGTVTARDLGVEAGDMLTIAGAKFPAWPVPGIAEGTVHIALGFGRQGLKFGRTGHLRLTDAYGGFDAYPIMPGTGAMWLSGQAVAKAGGTYKLAATQDYARLPEGWGWESDLPTDGGEFVPDQRPLAVEATYAQFTAEPDFVERLPGHANNPVLPADKLKSLWDEPPLTGKHQWGMTIDMNTCTGCNACLVACQVENNIPAVGKKEVLNGRELHWIRIDRYFKGSDRDDPRAVFQPVGCMHCENAPCENVCPVQATAHSPDGMNDMAYNRCIGTRYCANNCPYKVRRFNFHNYNLEIDPLLQMVKNPDVTVRFRGVIEKCSYCVQRISEAKIQAKIHGDGLVPDGAIVTACQQVCPSGSIVFGNIADPDSAVSKSKANPRNYDMLAELNNHPRTTYLARVRNPNPELG